jgi:anti-sigma regulatory factor (Ser/Thr protein kinase)
MNKKIALKNSIEEIPSMISEIEKYCIDHEIPESTTFHLTLVIDELVTNTINYGYDSPRTQEEIIIDLNRIDNCLQATLEDSGKYFNPLESELPSIDLSLEDKPIGGLGLHLMHKFTNRINYERIGNRNKLVLEIDL